MKRILLSLLFSGIFFIGFAQDVTVKKGKILFDNKEVGSVEGIKKKYILSDLQNNKILSIEVKDNSLPNGQSLNWYTLTNLKTNETNDVIATQSKFTFSLEKGTVRTFSEGNFKLLTENGFDEELINKVISINKKDYTEISTNKRDSINNVLKEANNLVSQRNIKFNNKNNTIYTQESYGAKMIIIGSLTYINNDYYLKENQETVGIWSNGVFTLENGKSYFVKNTSSMIHPSDIDEKFAFYLIGLALKEGYELENHLHGLKREMRNQEINNQIDAYNQKLQENKDNSVNLYDVTGYLIDEKGNKIDGKLSINFQTVTQGLKQSNVSSIPENLGKSVYLKTINEKGKEKSTRYKSNSGVKFCTESEDCYLGLKTIGNANNAIGNIMSLSADFSYFYKIVYDQDNYLILEDPESKSLYIKIPNQQKALYLGNSNKDKLQKNFDEYMNCNLNASDYDLTTIDGIKVLFEKYKSTCN